MLKSGRGHLCDGALQQKGDLNHQIFLKMFYHGTQGQQFIYNLG
jgi:hypothetical protein